jgi:hypothetical protein
MEETASGLATAHEDIPSGDSEEGEGELIIGFVAPTGTDSSKVHRVLTHVLAAYGHSHRHHRLSQMFSDPKVEERIGIRANTSSEYHRIKSAMDGGDALRSLAQQAGSGTVCVHSDRQVPCRRT